MRGAGRTTICFPVISGPTACALLKQQAALVIGFMLFLPLLCMDQLYLFCSPIRDSLLRRPHLPGCSWAWALAVRDSRKAGFPSHGCWRAKHDTDLMVQEFPLLALALPRAPHAPLCQGPLLFTLSPSNTFFLIIPPLLCAQFPSYGKACNSPDPKLPPSTSS